MCWCWVQAVITAASVWVFVLHGPGGRSYPGANAKQLLGLRESWWEESQLPAVVLGYPFV